MSHTLICWTNQEETKLYLIDNATLTPNQEKMLVKAAGQFVNATEKDDGAAFVSNALSDKTEYCFDGDPSGYCIWKDCEITHKKAAKGGLEINRVIVTGFWL